MKYEMHLKYNGLKVDCDRITGNERNIIDIPGNIEVHISGEMQWIETIWYLITLKGLLKKLS
jgi:hypothetical protein